MLKNLLTVLVITIAFANNGSAQNKYFLTYYNKAIKMGSEEAKDLLAEYFSEGDAE